MRPGVIAALLDLLFPPRCAFCGKVLGPGESGGLCAACQRALPWLTEGAAEQHIEFCSLCVSPLRYQGDVRASVHRYKFKSVRAYAPSYGTLVAQCVRDHLDGRYDLITWVPLSKKRLRERGYDQAGLLAAAVAGHLGTTAAETLCKTRHTHAQSGLEQRERRRANVMGAYTCPAPSTVEGKRVLLIDDVVTSGSTLSECARMLRMAGAVDVVCATLARAG